MFFDSSLFEYRRSTESTSAAMSIGSRLVGLAVEPQRLAGNVRHALQFLFRQGEMLHGFARHAGRYLAR